MGERYSWITLREGLVEILVLDAMQHYLIVNWPNDPTEPKSQHSHRRMNYLDARHLSWRFYKHRSRPLIHSGRGNTVVKRSIVSVP